MTVTVRNKKPLTVPDGVLRRAGLKHGDRVEFKVSDGVINIVPKPSAVNDEYTPEERRAIDVQLDQAEKGPFHGPFDTVGEMITHMKGELKKRKASGTSKRAR
jgi:bifunctional DNA-binding transcriptional regulator/antitoxin component of YhaV-PrlF toxin-antitoxin module